MSRDQWEQAIARAVVESSFRSWLLADPADALADYGLRDDQRPIVDTMRTNSLAELATRFLRAGAALFAPGMERSPLATDWI
jgi:hypothetical protein